jgi:Predicted methyltransferase regulatory domain/Methyltransferase domain
MSNTDGLLGSYKYKYSLSPVSIQVCMNFVAKEFSATKKKCRYLELGFGQGLSLNIHAAANGGEFWGVDPNPTFAVMANNLAQASGADLVIFNETFEEFSQRKDTPNFDVIVVSDVWSYLPTDTQNSVIDFVRHKLELGGAFYVNYNTPSGRWARLAPVRNLMKLYYDRVVVPADDMSTKIKNTVNFIESMVKGNPSTPYVSQLLDEMTHLKNSDLSDIEREYFSNCWRLFSFSDISELLSEAKLTFSCHGELLKNLDVLVLKNESAAFLKDIADPLLKEVMRDYLTDQHHRSDVWVKGAPALNWVERTEVLKDLRFILPHYLSAIDLDVKFPSGNSVLQNDVHALILNCLAEDNYSPKSAGDLVNYHQLRHLNLGKILDALIVLTSINYIYPVQNEDIVNNVKSRTNALNAYLLEQAVHVDAIHYLASPVTGCGINVSRIHQLFLLARLEEVSLPDEWASLAWQLISQQDQVLMIEHHKINTPAEGLNLLKEMAHEFAVKKLPILQALGIAN